MARLCCSMLLFGVLSFREGAGETWGTSPHIKFESSENPLSDCRLSSANIALNSSCFRV